MVEVEVSINKMLDNQVIIHQEIQQQIIFLRKETAASTTTDSPVSSYNR